MSGEERQCPLDEAATVCGLVAVQFGEGQVGVLSIIECENGLPTFMRFSAPVR